LPPRIRIWPRASGALSRFKASIIPQVDGS
jgi:hypothetical protein